MFRCIFAEILSLGGGHALSGGLHRAVAWFAAIVACVVLCLWTPWAVYLMAAVRLASIVEAGRRGRRGPVGGHWHWKPMLLFGAVSLGFFFATRSQALEGFKIPRTSPGMSPTLLPGDYVMGDKLSLTWRAPSRGEVVIYTVSHINLVGRIIGVGGDEVAVRQGVVYINGKAVPNRSLGKAKHPTYIDDADGELMREWSFASSEELGGHRYVALWPDDVSDEWFNVPTEKHGCAIEGMMQQSAIAGFMPALGPDGTTCILPKDTVFVLGDNRGRSIDSRHLGVYPVSTVRARVVGIWMGNADAGRFSRIGATD